MRKFRALVRLELLEFFSKYRTGMGYGATKRGRGLLVFTLLLLGIPFINMSIEAYQRFWGWGRPELGVAYMTMMAFLLLTFTAIPLLFSLYLHSSDFQFLTPLPIPTDDLVLAKLVVVWLYLTGINFVFLFPVALLVGLNAGLSVWSFLFSLLLIVVTPFPPLFLSSLAVLGLSNRRANRNRKSLLSLFFAFALLGLVLAAQLLLTNEGAARLVAWTERLTRLYPPAGWSAQVANGSLLGLLKYGALSFLCYWGLKRTVRKLYWSALLFSGTRSARRPVTFDYRLRKKSWQLLRRHLLIIMKQPVFLMNTILSLILPGLVFLIGILSGDLAAETLLLPNEQKRLLLFWLGLASTPALLTNLSATAISREGKAFWETRVLPVATWTNLRARIGTTILVNLAFSLLVTVVFFLYFPLEKLALLPGLFFVMMLTIFLAMTDLVINIYRPYLHWTNPAAAIKNNLNVLLSLAYRPLLAVIPFLSAVCFPGAGVYGILFYSGLLLFLLTLLVRKVLRTIMVEKFDQISG